MGDLRGSLYDLFGYFIPGLTASVGLHFIVWTLAWTRGVTDVSIVHGAVAIVTLVIVLYVLGHLLQALGNTVPYLSGFDVDCALSRGYSDASLKRGSVVLANETIHAINNTLKARFGDEVASMPPRDRFAFIDEGRVLAERDGDREIYIYHHGFYRGMMVALVFLMIGVVMRLVVGRTCIWTGTLLCFGRLELTLILVSALLAFAAFWSRFHRFEEYRFVRAVMLWLAVTNYCPPRKQDGE